MIKNTFLESFKDMVDQANKPSQKNNIILDTVYIDENGVETITRDMPDKPFLIKNPLTFDPLEAQVWVNPVIKDDNGVKFTVKDGKRIFESGATRSVNDGKPRFDLISPLAMEWLAQVLGAEAADKGASNYLKGIPEKVCIESLLRHVNAYQQGKEEDAVNILFNALALCHTIRMRENVAL